MAATDEQIKEWHADDRPHIRVAAKIAARAKGPGTLVPYSTLFTSHIEFKFTATDFDAARIFLCEQGVLTRRGPDYHVARDEAEARA